MGNPIRVHLTEGQAHDLSGADVLLPALLGHVKSFLADRAYDAQKRILDLLSEHNIEAVIPQKGNRVIKRSYDQEKYKWRHLVENFFQKLKQYRAIATRYDKRAFSFLGGIHLAASIIWLN